MSRRGARSLNRRGVALALAAFSLLTLAAATGCRRELGPDVVRRTPVTVEALQPGAQDLVLPKKPGSVRFAVIGDSGRGHQPQREVAEQMVAWRERFPFDFVLMLGDNVYDHHTPEDYRQRFEIPYQALLDAGVTFHAAIGNHDDPGQIFYEKFNMGGQRYYSFRRAERSIAGGLAGAGARFFALDSRSFDPDQLAWLRQELKDSGSRWKIVFFHHPLYTSGRYRTAARALRREVEPILVEGDVDVVLAGHEHFYERLVPQRGIAYFTSGAAGSLRPNDIRPSPLTARGFDTDYSFMLMEISGDELYFQAISRAGASVDAGVVRK
ncbi:MAG TPA: metallophosphoesterase [Vicinamibacterales bacterium]|nr:metallophosphoesterase [Vicinamibacterales bacterium]